MMGAFLLCAILVFLLKDAWGFTGSRIGRTQQTTIRVTKKAELSEVINSESNFQFHVAPMQCYTNESMRELCRALSPNAVLWTEMEKVPDLIDANAQGLERRFGRPGFKDIVLQVGGNDPTSMRICLERLSNFGYSFREINLNCGCPSIESGGGATFGASLMKKPVLTRELLETISKHKKDERTRVSLKCRIAVVEDPEAMTNLVPSEETYQSLHHYVSQAEHAGISHLILHARAAVLSGLSPVKNRQVPKLDYPTVERVARDFPFQVTLNGGITSLSQLDDLRRKIPATVVSSYMAGRWMLRRPLDLASLQHRHLKGAQTQDENDLSISSEDATRAVEQYTNFVRLSIANSSRKLDELCLPLFLVTEQLREDYDSQNEEDDGWLTDNSIERMYANIAETVTWLEDFRGSKKKKKLSTDSIDLKKLSSAFKRLVGTKVANKWKRNRAEL